MAKRITEETKMIVKAMLMNGCCGWEIEDKVGASKYTINKIRKEVQREGHDKWHVGGKESKKIKAY